MSAASCWNCSFLATKSVSQLSSIIALSAAATRPLVAVRSAPRSLTLVSPLMRSSSAALSKSPSASSRAFLAAIIPAPVASRSFLTSAAVMFAIVAVSLSRCVRIRGRATAPAGCPAGAARDVRPARLGRRRRRGSRASARLPPRQPPPRQQRASGSRGLGAAAASGSRSLGSGRRLGGRRLGAGALDGLAAGAGVPSAALPREQLLLPLGSGSSVASCPSARASRRPSVAVRTRAIRPSATASAMTRVSRLTDRIASSLPGIL